MKKMVMKKTVLGLVVLSTSLFPNSTNNDIQGWVQNGNKSHNTFTQRVYEWENFNGGCYCFHSAGATAINIRVGEKKINDESAWNYFKNELNGYYTRTSNGKDNKRGCLTSSQDWINVANKFHIKDLNVKVESYSTKDKLWEGIKKNINNNYPMLIPLNKYKPIYSGAYFSDVSGYSSDFGHAITIVGYMNFYDKRLAIRDPAISNKNLKSTHPNFFDYTIKLDVLEKYLQKREVLVFKNKKQIDLKKLAIQTSASLLKASGYVKKGDDKRYNITPKKNGTLVVELFNLSNDLDLYLYQKSPWLKKGYSVNSGTKNDKIVFNNAKKGTQYQVIVDGYRSGNYSVKAYMK